MNTKVALSALLLMASVGYCQSPNRCQPGQYRATDGSCSPDQTGESYLVGDGCNIKTCLDAECLNASVTTIDCSRFSRNRVGPAHQETLNRNLSAHFSSVSVSIYANGNKMMEGFDHKGKLVFTVYRDGRIVLAHSENK